MTGHQYRIERELSIATNQVQWVHETNNDMVTAFIDDYTLRIYEYEGLIWFDLYKGDKPIDAEEGFLTRNEAKGACLKAYVLEILK